MLTYKKTSSLIKSPLCSFVFTALTAFMAGHSSPGYGQLALPDQPLFTGINVTSNIMMLLDDSGSMDFEIIAGSHFLSCSYDDQFGSCNGRRPAEPGATEWFRPDAEVDDDNDPSANLRVSWVYFSDAADNVFTTGTNNGSCPGEGESDENRNRDRVSVKACEALGYDAYDQDWRFASYDHNLMYFNPNITYTPWLGFDNASFSAARSDPQSGNDGFASTENLGTGFGFSFFVWDDTKGYSGGSPNADNINMTTEPNGVIDLWDDYIRVNVSNTGIECTAVNYTRAILSLGDSDEGPEFFLVRNETALTGAACSAAAGNQSLSELQQNIANWYQYSRRRILTTKGALIAMLDAAPDFRYGSLYINGNAPTTLVPAEDVTDFTTHNQGIIDDFLKEYNPAGGTPLRNGLNVLGRYYAGEFNVPDPIVEACQKNFSLVFTDGFWNNTDPGLNDVDGDGASILGEPEGTITTLADVAHQYYITDLDPDLDDAVPPDAFDANPAQHMVTYSVSFGLQGALQDTDGNRIPDNIDETTGEPDDDDILFESDADWWQTGSTEVEQKIDDLWHAAYNSNGQFISARRPEELVNALRSILLNISDRTGSGASAAANGGSLRTDSTLYQARFNSGDWSGELAALRINSDGSVGTPIWDAGLILNQNSEEFFANTRQVFTYNSESGNGIEFKWNELTDDQKALLSADPFTFDNDAPTSDGLGAGRAAFIRGVDDLNIINGALTADGVDTDDLNLSTIFRDRDAKLGDLINSDPEFVGAPRFFYPFGGYADFANGAAASRPSILYVGGNDGMLHAFDASTNNGGAGGTELFTYVPDAVVKNLPSLTKFAYNHEFYVDGSPTYGDVQFSDGWRSVLVGGLRSGGQAVYALDITDPEGFSSDFADNVLWEFTDENDPDLGFTFAKPSIVRMANGKWAAIFGNGYNSTVADQKTVISDDDDDDSTVSTTGDAALFIVFIEDGVDGFDTGDFIKISTGAGSLESPNGLGPASGADINGDARVDFIYAGDLEGNVWKFDVSSSSSNEWGVDFNGAPLFTATTSGGEAQSITSRPVPVAHPAGIANGALVAFGTGQYIEATDTATEGQPTQTFYAVWDRSATLDPGFTASSQDNGFARSSLARVNLSTSGDLRFINEDTSSNPDYFTSDGTPDQRGFYIDLPITGERMIREVVPRDGTFFFVSLIPSDDRCLPGGTGFLMAVDISEPQYPPPGNGTEDAPVFDVNGDGEINELDNASGNVVIGLAQDGIPNLPVVVFDPRTACERNPALEGCSNGEDGEGGDTTPLLTDFAEEFFPPPLNSGRACGADGNFAYLYTTNSDGNISQALTQFSSNNCGRQAWQQRR